MTFHLKRGTPRFTTVPFKNFRLSRGMTNFSFFYLQKRIKKSNTVLKAVLYLRNINIYFLKVSYSYSNFWKPHCIKNILDFPWINVTSSAFRSHSMLTYTPMLGFLQTVKRHTHWVLFPWCSAKGLKGTVVNRWCPSLNGRSLKITLTVPFSKLGEI